MSSANTRQSERAQGKSRQGKTQDKKKETPNMQMSGIMRRKYSPAGQPFVDLGSEKWVLRANGIPLKRSRGDGLLYRDI